MARFTVEDDGESIDSIMGDIKAQFGEAAARGEQSRFQVEESPTDAAPSRFSVEQEAPSQPKLRLPKGASVSPEGNLVFPQDKDFTGERTPKWYDRPLEIAGSILSAPGDYTRGLLKGRPGERVSPEDMYNANEVDTPEQFLIRGIAGELTDPLMLIGGGILGRTAKEVPAPRALERTGQSVDLSTIGHRGVSPLERPSEPSITELARSHQYSVEPDSPVNYQAKQKSTYIPEQVTPIELTPTGSPTRNFPEDPGTTVTDPALQVTPTGSLVRRAHPEEGPVGSPDPTAVPYPPDTLGTRGTGEPPMPYLSAEERIRARHPEAFQRPLKSAEDLLAEKQARQAELAAQRERELAQMQSPQESKPLGPESPFYPTPTQAGPGSTLFRKDNLSGETLSRSLVALLGRAMTRTYDALAGTGPLGQEMASIRYYADDYARQATSKNMTDWLAELQRIYPENKSWFRNPAREWSLKDYIKISDKEYEALVDMYYSGGKYTKSLEGLDPAAQIRVKDAWEKTWHIYSGRASSDPGVRQLNVRNSVTGEEFPLGVPSSFIPHQYVHGKDIGKFGERTLERMYRHYAQGKAAPMTFTDFKDNMRMAAGNKEKRFLGIEEARLFDASEIAAETGKTIFQVMKEHGLDTDLFRTMIRYNLGAYHRGQLKMFEPLLRELEKAWRTEVGHDPKAIAWLNTIDSRAKGMTVHDDIDRVNARWLQQWKAFTALTLLPRATIAASNQMVYGLAKANTRSFLDMMMDPLVGNEAKRVASLVPESGALLANTIQEMSRVDGLLGSWSTAQLRLTGFNALDRFQRNTAARLGFYYAKDLGRRLLKNPDDAYAQKALQELRLNPPEVLDSMKATGTLDDGLAKRAMQVYSDQTMGTTGLRGRPLFTTSDHWSTQMMMNLRGQLASNMAEARQMIYKAPDFWTGVARATKLIGGAALVGTTTKTIRDLATGDLGELKGSAKELEKRLGSEAVARLVDNTVYGLGTIATDAMLTGFTAHDDLRFAGIVFGTPASQLATLRRLTKDPGRTILKTLPSPVYPLDKAAESLGVLEPKKRN